MIKKEVAEVRIKLIEPMLGTVPLNRKVFEDHVQAKAQRYIDEGRLNISEEDFQQEIESIEEVAEKAHTGFMRDERGNLIIMNYMIKGFLKSACEVCMEVGAINKIPAYKKWIDLLLFVEPRALCFLNGDGAPLTEPDGVLDHPVRAMTLRGPRVALVRSDLVVAGRELSFNVEILKNRKFDLVEVEQMFDYGRFVGLGQWRGSGGYGKFELVTFQGMSEAK